MPACRETAAGFGEQFGLTGGVDDDRVAPVMALMEMGTSCNFCSRRCAVTMISSSLSVSAVAVADLAGSSAASASDPANNGSKKYAFRAMFVPLIQ